MASITSREDQDGIVIGWQVRVRKKGYLVQTRTFRLKSDAQVWARSVENEMDRGIFVSRAEAESTTLSDALDRYAREILPSKKSIGPELARMAHLKSGLGNMTLAAITSSTIAQYRDKRLKAVGPQSVSHEINLLSRVYRAAIMEWGIAIPGGVPTVNVRKPRLPQGRDRRLRLGEEQALLGALPPSMRAIVRFALETAMRRGEIAAMRWEHIDLKTRVLTIPETKTGVSRRVPLSTVAVSILEALPRRIDGRVWAIAGSESMGQMFIKGRRKAGIEDLHFHDLRHEATSRLFEKGFNPMEVSTITGHKTLQMLKRYTHLRAEDLAKRMG
ncbi:site-specific integrase [Acidithiobacillus sp.]|uniref:site-specific integrase n=1 Tax=Acidithiobacillus sp. TaxID=1872118 RepID=UPI003D015878